jgi:tetratricopeptide (TPR) repeat protein
VEDLQKPLAGDRARALPLVQRALSLQQAGKIDRALERLGRALELDPSLVEGRLMRAQIRMQEGDHLDLLSALRDVSVAALIQPTEPGVMVAEGLVRFHLGDSTGAQELLTRYLKSSPPKGSEVSQSSAHEVLGKLALRREDLEAAERPLQSAGRLAPPRAELVYSLARVARARGDGGQERRLLQQAVQMEPEHLAAHLDLYRWFLKSGEAEAAERERQIHDCLRALQDNTSADFAADHVAKARLWQQLAELLPAHGAARMAALREWHRSEDWERVQELGQDWLAAEIHPEVVYMTARAQAHLGLDQAATETVALLDQAQPAVPDSARESLNQELQQIRVQRSNGEADS